MLKLNQGKSGLEVVVSIEPILLLKTSHQRHVWVLIYRIQMRIRVALMLKELMPSTALDFTFTDNHLLLKWDDRILVKCMLSSSYCCHLQAFLLLFVTEKFLYTKFKVLQNRETWNNRSNVCSIATISPGPVQGSVNPLHGEGCFFSGIFKNFQ